MGKGKKILTGPGYKYNYKKTELENWDSAKEFYAKKGVDIGEFKEMSDVEEAELKKLLENIKI